MRRFLSSRPRRRYSQPTRLRSCPACLRNSRIGPNGFWRSTSPVASGETTLPRSWRHSGTDDETFDSVIAFAERIGMVPIALHKEQPGYVINTLLIPWVRAGMSLVVKGVAREAAGTE